MFFNHIISYHIISYHIKIKVFNIIVIIIFFIGITTIIIDWSWDLKINGTLSSPLKINGWNLNMMGLGRWFSPSRAVFSGSMLIFRSVFIQMERLFVLHAKSMAQFYQPYLINLDYHIAPILRLRTYGLLRNDWGTMVVGGEYFYISMKILSFVLLMMFSIRFIDSSPLCKSQFWENLVLLFPTVIMQS